jgi:lipoprotein-anchoring transpeptidase ErfK/SrfK
MLRVRGVKAAVGGRLWRIAVLTGAAATAATQAEAAFYYWSGNPGYYRPGPFLPQHRQKPWRQVKKIRAPERELAKPQGPLIIAISIEKQNLRIYDANGFYAATPISTGMKGHSTPMGVFSVIQKQKLHHSNIYSWAPMPYMQRITWSGVALHAGVLPGYPASHGCIRMPMAFSLKMWNWTRMGARVVIVPGEITPVAFSHPLLMTQKLVAQVNSEPHVDSSIAPKSDEIFVAGTPIVPANSEAEFALRSTVGHAQAARPVTAELSTPALSREKTHTAASGSLMTDMVTEAALSQGTPHEDRNGGSSLTSEETTAAEIAVIENNSDVGAAKSHAPLASGRSGETPVEGPSETLGGAVGAIADIEPAASDTTKNQAHLPDAAKPAAGKSDFGKSDFGKSDLGKSDLAMAPRRAGQIAAFISRKDSKIYVRQNFAPLFEAPVTIAAGDRPLGTHVFTAQIDSNDANIVHWSVVSLPAASRHGARRENPQRATHWRKTASAVIEAKLSPAEGPSEALDRVRIPADAMARIAEALSTGSSIIVSDQGIGAGETGEGTDFIVSLR